MTLHTCEYINPTLRTSDNGEYVCFAMRMTRPLYLDMVPGETAAGVRAFRVSVIEPLFPFSILRLPFAIAETGYEGQ